MWRLILCLVLLIAMVYPNRQNRREAVASAASTAATGSQSAPGSEFGSPRNEEEQGGICPAFTQVEKKNIESEGMEEFDKEYFVLMKDVSAAEFCSFLLTRPFVHVTDDNRTTTYTLGEAPFEKRYASEVMRLTKTCPIVRDWVWKEWDVSRTAPGTSIIKPVTEMATAPLTRGSRLKGELDQRVWTNTLRYAAVFLERVSLGEKGKGIALPEVWCVFPGGAEEKKPAIQITSKLQVGGMLEKQSAELVMMALLLQVSRMILWKDAGLRSLYDVVATVSVWEKCRDQIADYAGKFLNSKVSFYKEVKVLQKNKSMARGGGKKVLPAATAEQQHASHEAVQASRLQPPQGYSAEDNRS
uniref:Uncharacterized protein n=1 Tax=Chromera velia CCMP2878 TaxID=1169474 RepID=A0A0G4IBK3_9ALVE|eukprot:Cvel_2194.t1-p1 / transcript=Cvel_2194.t1 / gene=Cvel_2194 / organism=Chromera_velia_CCMP2878 / gene_product=hypothetical protein / transcript_product=hypothetical protein / location=Cvel_scaffold85:9804-11212(+) / protein_length=356 / sequence_SO=supercontig / SO=protein_coding / is_pseudo=false